MPPKTKLEELKRAREHAKSPQQAERLDERIEQLERDLKNPVHVEQEEPDEADIYTEDEE